MQIFYTVRKGDTLFSIMRMYNTSSSLIFEANNLETPIIHPGTNLKKYLFRRMNPPIILFFIIFDDINHFLLYITDLQAALKALRFRMEETVHVFLFLRTENTSLMYPMKE